MKLALLALSTGLLLSSCTYNNTYVEPKPEPKPIRRTTTTKSATITTPRTSADGFQAVTKPSSYSN